MLREEQKTHVCDTKDDELHNTKPYKTQPDDIIFRLAKLLADNQRVLRDASNEINLLSG